MNASTVAEPGNSYAELKKKYGGWKPSDFEAAIKTTTKPSELDTLRVAIKFFLEKPDAIKLGQIVDNRLNELSDRLISFGDFMRAYKNAESGFKEMRDRCVKYGNNWVCASYMSQVEFFIDSQAKDSSDGSRAPLNSMLSKVQEGYELVKILESRWKEFKGKEKSIPGFIEEEIKDIFKGLLAKQIGLDRFWQSMDIRSEIEGKPKISPIKTKEYLQLWAANGIVFPEQVIKPEIITTPTQAIKPQVPPPQLEPEPSQLDKVNKRIEELKRKQAEREQKKTQPEPQPTPVTPIVTLPEGSTELELMKIEIERRIADIYRKKMGGGGQAGETGSKYGAVTENNCTDWDFGTFEAMLPGIMTQQELDALSECAAASHILTDDERTRLDDMMDDQAVLIK